LDQTATDRLLGQFWLETNTLYDGKVRILMTREFFQNSRTGSTIGAFTSGWSIAMYAGDQLPNREQKFSEFIPGCFYAHCGLPDCQSNSSLGVKLIPRMITEIAP